MGRHIDPAARVKSPHQQRVEAFMQLARQEVPSSPTVPDVATRLLRAKLILEEALETIHALGVVAKVVKDQGDLSLSVAPVDNFSVDLAELADGCADLRVVTTGTLSACGIADETLQEEVDYNNLAKFGEGHSFREDGKLIKPPNHQPPDIEGVLRRQGRTD